MSTSFANGRVDRGWSDSRWSDSRWSDSRWSDKTKTISRLICFASYRVFKKKVPTFVLLISRLPKHLENWLCTFFNSPTFAESKNNNILILGFKLEKLLTKL